MGEHRMTPATHRVKKSQNKLHLLVHALGSSLTYFDDLQKYTLR